MTSNLAEPALTTEARRDAPLLALARRRHRDAFLLTAMIVSIIAFDLLWVSLNKTSPRYDFAFHLADSLAYKDIFTLSHPLRLLETYMYYPPFPYLVTDVFYVLFGTALSVAILSNVFFVAILVFATYGVGKQLWNGRVGLLSALFVSTTPMLVTLFKEYMLDASLTAMVTAALYFLIRSDSFRSRGPSLLLGVTCGLGMLTKWTFPFFLALPIFVAALVGVHTSFAQRSSRRIVNMAGAGAVAFAICGVWYVHNWSILRRDTSFNASQAGAIDGHPPIGSLSSLLWYFWNLLNNQLYLIPFLFLVTGVVVTVVKDKSASRNFYPVLTIVGTYFAFTFLRNKDFRYTLPMLPVVAVVATSWLEYLRPQARRVLSAGLAAYGIAAFFVISFGTGLLPHEIRIPIKARSYTSDLVFYEPTLGSPRTRGIVVFAQRGYDAGKPISDDLHPDDVFRAIGEKGGNAFGYQGDDSVQWRWPDVRYYQLKYHLQWVNPDATQFLVVHTLASASAPPGFVQIAGFRTRTGESLSLYQRA